MSAQAEEVVASAAELADMARQLDALVARFTLANDVASPEPAPGSGARTPVALRQGQGSAKRAA